MSAQKEFERFLKKFVPKVSHLEKRLAEAHWKSATTGQKKAADRRAKLDFQLRSLFSDRGIYEKLSSWAQSGEVTDPLLSRQLTLLLLGFKGNMLPPQILSRLAQGEAKLEQIYSSFRPKFEGKPASENDLREILKKETRVVRRKAAWGATKEVGLRMAPRIRRLVSQRNQGARRLGYPDFWRMQVVLQEIDPDWLLATFETLAQASDLAYQRMLKEIKGVLAPRFSVEESELGPWAWGDPFCQEDPLAASEVDRLVSETGIEIADVTTSLYDSIGLDTRVVLARSDLYERPKKNQHGFCTDIDREGDVRVLVNLRPVLYWLDTMLHEMGHAVYFLGVDRNLPWVLRSMPIFATEAMALLAGQQAWQPEFLRTLVTKGEDRFEPLLQVAKDAQKRRQLIFSRWVLVMVNFEAQMYADPDQDLNLLWWSLVQKYQKIQPPENREDKQDWAAKVHFGSYPAYYHNYLLGEFFALMLRRKIADLVGESSLTGHPEIGKFLAERLFSPGHSLRWDDLIVHAVGETLSPKAWLSEFAS